MNGDKGRPVILSLFVYFNWLRKGREEQGSEPIHEFDELNSNLYKSVTNLVYALSTEFDSSEALGKKKV